MYTCKDNCVFIINFLVPYEYIIRNFVLNYKTLAIIIKGLANVLKQNNSSL